MKNKMISWISAMLVCVNACGTMSLYASAEQTGESVTETAAEQSNTCGDRLTWSFDSGTGALTIAGTGDMDFHGDFYAPWHGVCKKIQSLSLPEGLTSIEVNAFAECDNLKSVSVPESVTEIGDCAFYDCAKLAEINIPEHVTAVGAEILTGTEWFDAQPDGVVYLGHIAVGWQGDMQPEVEIRQGTTVLAPELFYGQTALTSCTLPDGIIAVPDDCFSLCTGLQKINMPDSVETVGDAFQDVTLPADASGVVYLGRWVIGCTNSAADVVLRDDTKGIADRAFEGCGSLSSIELNEGLTYIGSLAFSGTKITRLMIPDTVRTVGAALCCGCSALKEVHLPDSVTALADIPSQRKETSLSNGLGFFEECKSLESVELPAHLTEIGESAFFHCDALQEIVIPASVKKIAHGAFGWCSGLKKITILNPQCEIYDNATTLFGALDMSQSFYYVYKGTIRAYEDSSAEEHAAKYGIAFEAIVPEGEYLRGDVNGDGKVSLEDAQSCLQAYCRILSNHPHGLDDAAFRAADIDKNGTLSPEDATCILRYYTVSGLSGKPLSWKTLFQQNSD